MIILKYMEYKLKGSASPVKRKKENFFSLKFEFFFAYVTSRLPMSVHKKISSSGPADQREYIYECLVLFI